MSLIPILITLIIFGIIVIIHEYGHFIAALKCGVDVLEFSVGMGPIIFSKRKNGILYSVRAFPLGGFCRMKGEEDVPEGGDTTGCFNSVSVFKRMIIVLAGPFMNFLLAFLVFTIISAFIGTSSLVISDIVEDSPAMLSGEINVGDRILKINGKSVHIYQDLSYCINDTNENITLTTKTVNGEKKTFTLNTLTSNGKRSIGIYCTNKTPLIGQSFDGYKRSNILDTIRNGFWLMIFMVKITIIGLAGLFTTKESLNKVAGPIGLTSEVGKAYKETISVSIGAMLLTMLNITGLLSANLGVMNLIPIPALDGGKFLFYVIEILRGGKRIPVNKEAMASFISFALLMLLGIVVAFNDVLRIFN